jgi:CcmD family protein
LRTNPAWLIAAIFVCCGVGNSAAAVSRALPALVALQQPAATQPAPDGFEPVSSLPAASQEQLPAAPLVMAAYAFVWLAILGYLWSLWRRLGAVERELGSVARRVGEAAKR